MGNYYNKMRKVKGSFTIEAAFIMPLILITMGFCCEQAVHWYQSVEISAELKEEDRVQPAEWLRKNLAWKEIWEETGDGD